MPNNDEGNDIANMPFQIEVALKMIPEFKGDKDNLHKFIACCDIVSSTCITRADHTNLLNVIKTKLSGPAYNIIKYKTFDNWDELKLAVQDQYLEKRTIAQIQTELINCRQNHSEHIREFANRIERLTMDLTDACIASEGNAAANIIQNLNSKLALRSFVEGLQNPIKLLIKASRFNTLQEAISAACDEERNITCNKQIQNQQNFKTETKKDLNCFKCGKRNHIAKYCYSASNNTVPRYPSSNIKREANVNNITIICRYCKNVGHTIENCRKRQFNNSRRSHVTSNDMYNANRRLPAVETASHSSNQENDQAQRYVRQCTSSARTQICLNSQNFSNDFANAVSLNKGTSCDLVSNSAKPHKMNTISNVDINPSSLNLYEKSEITENSSNSLYPSSYTKCNVTSSISPSSTVLDDRTDHTESNEYYQIFTVDNNIVNATCIEMPLLLATTKSAKLLLDTGSDISILKLSETDDDAAVNTNIILKLKGITDEAVSSLGLSEGIFQLNDNVSISHPFHIVPNSFPIPCQGILGKDFLKYHQAVINYESSKLTIQIQGELFQFNMTDPCHITVPPRSEYIARIPVNLNKEQICLQHELQPGLLIGNSIVSPKNGFCNINVINSTEEILSFNPKQNVDCSYSQYLKDIENKVIVNSSVTEVESNVSSSKSDIVIEFATKVKKKETSKDYYDKNSDNLQLKVGDLVLLRNESNIIGKSKKLLPLYKGPYEVISVDSNQNCTISVNRKHIKVHKNRLKIFHE